MGTECSFATRRTSTDQSPVAVFPKLRCRCREQKNKLLRTCSERAWCVRLGRVRHSSTRSTQSPVGLCGTDEEANDEVRQSSEAGGLAQARGRRAGTVQQTGIAWANRTTLEVGFRPQGVLIRHAA